MSQSRRGRILVIVMVVGLIAVCAGILGFGLYAALQGHNASCTTDGTGCGKPSF